MKRFPIYEVMKGSAMEAGLNGIYSKMPKEKVRMPVKSAAEAFRLAADGEEEFYNIIKELTKNIKDADTSKGRIKGIGSLERKCRDFGLEVADLDDVSGKMIIVKTIEDEEAIAKMLKDDDRVFRIFDYMTSDDSGGYYAIHANYKLSNGLVAELQIITIRCMVYKSLVGHILYEVRREMYPKRNEKEYKQVFDRLNEILEEGFLECRKADEEHTKIPQPKIDLSDDELDLIKKAVTENTWTRFEYLLDKRTKEINTKLTDKEKDLVEHKSLYEYIADSLK